MTTLSKLRILASTISIALTITSYGQLIELTAEQKQQFIDTHNRYRAEVGVPPLVWSDKLSDFSAEWATKKGKQGCKMQHRPDNDFGENIYWSSGMAFDPEVAVTEWGNEKLQYNNEVIGQEKAMVGHYTQMVWRTTTQVGCAAYQCEQNLIVICNYNPAGNWMGQHPYKP